VPIVVLTANADPSLADLALRAGAEDYLIKSVHDFTCIERALLAAIRRSRQRRRAPYSRPRARITG
jgi:PleD family two-component response regulator